MCGHEQSGAHLENVKLHLYIIQTLVTIKVHKKLQSVIWKSHLGDGQNCARRVLPSEAPLLHFGSQVNKYMRVGLKKDVAKASPLHSFL